MHKHFEEITEDSQDVFTYQPYQQITFISRKYYTLVLNHELYNKMFPAIFQKNFHMKASDHL